MGVIDRILRDSEQAFQSESGGEVPDLGHIDDELVYEMLRDALPFPEEEIERQSLRSGLGLQVAYGHSVFVLGGKLYFKWVEQKQNYRCTDRTFIWANGGNYGFAGRACAGSGKTIYQLTRPI